MKTSYIAFLYLYNHIRAKHILDMMDKDTEYANLLEVCLQKRSTGAAHLDVHLVVDI